MASCIETEPSPLAGLQHLLKLGGWRNPSKALIESLEAGSVAQCYRLGNALVAAAQAPSPKPLDNQNYLGSAPRPHRIALQRLIQQDLERLELKPSGMDWSPA
jgi:hypothetical protein